MTAQIHCTRHVSFVVHFVILDRTSVLTLVFDGVHIE